MSKYNLRLYGIEEGSSKVVNSEFIVSDIQTAFNGISFAVHYSRNHMRENDGRIKHSPT